MTGGEHIDDVKGSLGRIQACNWALRRSGDPGITDAVLEQGLAVLHEPSLLEHRPPAADPHEAYCMNAGYFYFFGHYYCGLVIELLPAERRERFRELLRPKVLQTQRADGSFCDFLGSSYMVTSSTAFAAMALQVGL